MRISWRTFLILSLGLLWMPPGVPAATAHSRVVLVTIDAASSATVDDLIARGILPRHGAFGRMAQRGTRAGTLIPPNVSSTPIAHATIYTGMLPSVHGIVGVTLPLPGEDIRSMGSGSSGFDAPTATERIWTLAARQGQRVACITAPGANATREDDTCAFTLAFPQSLSEPLVVEVASAANSPGMSHPKYGVIHAVDSSPLLEISPRDGGAFRLFAFQLGAASEHRYLLSASPTSMDGPQCMAVPGSPCAIATHGDGGLRWLWVQVLEPATRPGPDRLYISPLIAQRTDDAERLAEMHRQIGYMPPEASNRLSTRGVVPESVWLADTYRATDYLANAVGLTLQRADWDLLVTYLPLLDQVQHRYMLTDPRQPDYARESGARRERCRREIEQAYRRVDAILAGWMKAAPPGTHFVVASDHGMAPTHATIRLLNVLQGAGLRVADRGDTDVWARSSGGTAHIYVNARSRFAGGTVADADVDVVTEKIVAAVRELRDSTTGENVFETVRRHDELGDLGLSNPRAGDVFVGAREGWSISSRFMPGGSVIVGSTVWPDTIAAIASSEVDRRFLETGFANETSPGTHGHVAGPRTLEAIFFAFGERVSKRRIEKVTDLDILPSVFELLGIRAPAGAPGHSVVR